MGSSGTKSWLDLSPKPLNKLGIRAWMLLGIAGVGALAIWGLAATASIIIPLILAIILGILFAPIVDILEKRKMPRALGATIAMLLVLLILGGTVWIVVTSVLGQWPTIQKQMTAAYNSLAAWFATLNIPESTRTAVQDGVQKAVPQLGQALGNALLNSASNIAALLFGTFLAFYMLFFTLKDNELIRESIGHNIGLPEALGLGIIEDAFTAIRQYFQGMTLLASITTVATMLGLWAVGVPLIFTIGVVTFILSYIPFFGAILSGAFAVLIALGAGGPQMAIYTLIVVLLAQNVLQSVIQGWAIGGALDLHPLIVLIATTVGSIFGGLIGGMLGAPLAAIGVRVMKRLRVAWDEEAAEDARAAGDAGPQPAGG
jgi:putative heme transporter